MKNFQIIKNNEYNEFYGIQDLDSGKVIIPCMYGVRKLENIIEIIPVNNGYDAYILKGIDIENNIVYGLYNAFTNDLVEPLYDRVCLDELIQASIISFSKDGKIVSYDLKRKKNCLPIKEKIKLITNDFKTYGIATSDNKVIIPPEYHRKEVINIGDVSKLKNGVYILKDKHDKNKIIGFYDSNRNILKRKNFASYKVAYDVLILKEEMVSVEKKNKYGSLLMSHGGELLRKAYISIYDTKNGKYIYGDYYDEEIRENTGDGYYYSSYNDVIHECITKSNGILILNKKAFYDTKTGYFYQGDNVRCYVYDKKIIVETDEFDTKLIGCYDLKTRTFEKYTKLSSSFIGTDGKFVKDCDFYLSQNKSYIYFWDEFHPLEEYSDFIKFSADNYTFMFDKSYNSQNYVKRKLKILEIKPTDIELLGIPINSTRSVYLINGNLYTYKKNNLRKTKGTRYYNFIPITSQAISAVEYEYGTCSIEASCDAELDFILDDIEKRENELSKVVETFFYQSEELMEDYPKLIRKKK